MIDEHGTRSDDRGTDMKQHMRHERPEMPPGWSYNPSAWKERWPLLCLAAVGLVAAIYTALAQLAVIPSMWDPSLAARAATP